MSARCKVSFYCLCMVTAFYALCRSMSADSHSILERNGRDVKTILKLYGMLCQKVYGELLLHSFKLKSYALQSYTYGNE